MAIAFRAGSMLNTAQTATNTNQLTITIAQATLAHSCLVMAVSTALATRVVSTITDTAGNKWTRQNAATGTGVNAELWIACDAAVLAVGNTIVVTVDSNGRFGTILAEYTGVAFFLGTQYDNSGVSSSPTTTGAQTVDNAGDFLITAMGGTANNTWTVQTGNLRGQIGTTALRCGLMDNTGSTSLTCSSTSTAMNWATASVDVRLIPIADDLNSWSDTGFSKQLNVTLTQVFADSTLNNWSDALSKIIGIAELLSDDASGNWADVKSVGYGSVVTDNLSSWLDALGAGYGLGVTDTESANWVDALRAGYGNAVVDFMAGVTIVQGVNGTGTISGGTGGAGEANQAQGQSVAVPPGSKIYVILAKIRKTNSPTDGVLVNVYDSANGGTLLGSSDVLDHTVVPSPADVVIFSFATPVDVGSNSVVYVRIERTGARDTTNNYSVAFSSGDNPYPDGTMITRANNSWAVQALNDLAPFMLSLVGDSLTPVISFEEVLADNNGASGLNPNFRDGGFGLGYGNLVTDDLNSWSEAFAKALASSALTLVVSDDLNSWLDVLGAGYGLVNSDQLILVDSLGAGYGGQFSDTLNAWSDLVVSVLGIGLLLDDQDTTWLDALALGYGNAAVDQITMSDQLGAGYGNFTSDQMTLTDKLGAGYGAATSDQLILVDSLGAGYGAALSDNTLNNWLDAASLIFGMVLVIANDLNNWADKLTAGYGVLLSEQIVTVDSLGAGYGAILSDNLNSWADLVNIFFNSPLIQLTLSDDLNSWADALKAGYGTGVSDQLVLVDSLGAGYGALLSDDLNVWLNALAIGYGNTLADQLTAMTDKMTAGYGAGVSDQLVLVDSLGAGYGAQLSDSINNWLDVFQPQLLTPGLLILNLSDAVVTWADALRIGYGNAVDDQLTLLDQLGVGYGSKTSDQMVFVDSFGAGYGAGLSDTWNSWSDLLQMIYGMIETVTDQDTTWADALGAGYGMGLSDQLVVTDAISAGYGMVLADSWTWTESLGVGYGLVVVDSSNSWIDLLQFNLAGGFLSLDVSDDGSGNWKDAILTQTQTGSFATFLRLKTVPRVRLSGVDTRSLVSFIRLRIQPRVSFSWSSTAQRGRLYLSVTDTVNQWSDDIQVPSVQANYQWTAAEDLNQWGDSLVRQSNQMLLVDVEDGLNAWSDELSTQSEYRWMATESLDQWQDALAKSDQIYLVISDTLNQWVDQIPGMHSDYGWIIQEDLNQWQDSMLRQIDQRLLVNVEDAGTDWNDVMVGFLG